MLIIPAVDIKNGKAVRLVQGKADQETVYDDDPVRAARRWVDAGAKRIHIVDLDGAFDGRPKNAEVTFAILKEIRDCEIEIGGGLRSKEAISELLDRGAARCVIGTKAVEDRDFLRDLSKLYPGKINVGLDAKGGYVATKGWVEISKLKAVDLIGELYDLPLGEVIYTDIDRDGMLSGPNMTQLEAMSKASRFPLIASGGVTTLDNIAALKKLDCYGCIIGKALFDGRLDVKEALEAAGN